MLEFSLFKNFSARVAQRHYCSLRPHNVWLTDRFCMFFCLSFSSWRCSTWVIPFRIRCRPSPTSFASTLLSSGCLIRITIPSPISIKYYITPTRYRASPYYSANLLRSKSHTPFFLEQICSKICSKKKFWSKSHTLY